MTSDLGPMIEIIRPARGSVPVIVSSPHSGQIYPPCVLSETRLHLNQLRRLEDAHVDHLFDMAPCCGMPMLKALFARAYIDPNREPSEFDQDLLSEPLPPHANGQSAKARAGLGTIPSRIAGHPIYRQKLSLDHVEQRVRLAYWPYHHALQRLIEECQARFGRALLLDCHSMPSFNASGALSDSGSSKGMIDIALGDRFGSSCMSSIVRHAEAFLASQGLNVTRNRPYAGGHITAHYGRPHLGVHALQIEVRRGLYMDETKLRLHSNIDDIKAMLGGLLDVLSELMRESTRMDFAKAMPAE